MENITNCIARIDSKRYEKSRENVTVVLTTFDLVKRFDKLVKEYTFDSSKLKESYT